MNTPVLLALDNCFASKRWTEPLEWMRITADMGIDYVEASADTECDPLYSDSKYLKDWVKQVCRATKETGVKIANLYSGHGTYSTLGLAHPDSRNARRMQEKWLGGMLTLAAELQCGLGFYCHAFPQRILQTPSLYHSALETLYDRLAQLAEKATACGVPEISLEQMYTPHQIPWTIATTKKLLGEVKKRSGKNFYLTIDTGHQCMQRKFLRPSPEKLESIIASYRKTKQIGSVWLGPEIVYEMIRGEASLHNINIVMDEFSYLFASEEDMDPYIWLSKLGKYAPIIHLQQTDGTRSAHLPFDARHNKTGIIHGEKVLTALQFAAGHPQEPLLPVPCGKHFLTLEIFGGTGDLPNDILNNLKNSAKYWKNYV